LGIQVADRIEYILLLVGADAFRTREIQDRFATAAEGDALVGGWQETAAPERGSAARPARSGLKDYESGQALRFAAQAVGHPRPHRGTAGLSGTRVQEEFRRRVVEDVGLHRAHDGQVIDDAPEVREAFRDVGSALSAASEFTLGAEALGMFLREGIHEGEAF